MIPDLSYSKHKILVCLKHYKLLKQPLKTTAPPKTIMSPKKRTISIGNTSSNHGFLGDMFVFRGVSAHQNQRCFLPKNHPPRQAHLRPPMMRTATKRSSKRFAPGGILQGFNGTEIRRSPVVVGSLSTIICKVLYIPGGAGFLNHQQYESMNVHETADFAHFEHLLSLCKKQSSLCKYPKKYAIHAKMILKQTQSVF